MRRHSGRCGLVLSAGGLILMLVGVGAGKPTGSVSQQVDCGPAALYALLALEGNATDLERIVARLPHRRSGHSLKELREAARSFGMTLDGWHIKKDARAIDRPLLAYIQDAPLRHFLVIRPVGHTGTLVQVIDTDEPPRIMEKAELVASRQWTGFVLAPRRMNWSTMGGVGLLAAAGLLGLGHWMMRRGPRGVAVRV